MRRAPFLLLFCVAGATSCAKRTNEEESARRWQWVHDIAMREDGGQSWELSTRDDVRFGDGFFPLEHTKPNDARSEGWRWMGRHGVVNLKTNGGKPHRLVIGGGLVMGINHSTITFTIDGVVLDVHVVDKGWLLDKVVPSSMLTREWVELVVTPSAFLVPPFDSRELGATVSTLRWEPVDSAQ